MKKNHLFRIVLLLLIAGTMKCGKSGSSEPATPPVLTTAEPASGIVGDPVLITGTNLTDADNVLFGSVSSKVISSSAMSLATVVPTGATVGVGSIKVHNKAGNSNDVKFEVIATPANVDADPPTIAKVIPSETYSDYPVLIYGNNLSGTLAVTINDKPATIFTNNKNVVTITVPKDLPAGSGTIKVKTVKGSATIAFKTKGAPLTPATFNFSIVNIPPPAYVSSISNEWSCGFFSQRGGGTFIDINNSDVSGQYAYSYNAGKTYNEVNYVEFTNQSTGETLAGLFSSKFDNPCVLHMILISSKTGLIRDCTFDKARIGVSECTR